MLYRNFMKNLRAKVDSDSWDKVDWEGEVDKSLEVAEAENQLRLKYPIAFKAVESQPTKTEIKEMIVRREAEEKRVEEDLESAKKHGQIMTPEEERMQRAQVEQREFVKSLGDIDGLRNRDVRDLYSLKWKLLEHRAEPQVRDALHGVERVITEKEYPDWSSEKRSWYVKTLMANHDQSRHDAAYPIQEWRVLDTSHITPDTYVLHYRIEGSWHTKTFDSYDQVKTFMLKGESKEYVHPIRGDANVAWIPKKLPPLPDTSERIDSPSRTYTLGQTSIADEDRQWEHRIAIWDKEGRRSREIRMRDDDWQVLKTSITKGAIPKRQEKPHLSPMTVDELKNLAKYARERGDVKSESMYNRELVMRSPSGRKALAESETREAQERQRGVEQLSAMPSNVKPVFKEGIGLDAGEYRQFD